VGNFKDIPNSRKMMERSKPGNGGKKSNLDNSLPFRSLGASKSTDRDPRERVELKETKSQTGLL